MSDSDNPLARFARTGADAAVAIATVERLAMELQAQDTAASGFPGCWSAIKPSDRREYRAQAATLLLEHKDQL